MKVLLFVVLLQACSTTMTPYDDGLSNDEDPLRDGNYDHAIASYKKLLQTNPASDIAADAQFAIAYTLVYYDNPHINYTLAMVEFKRFLTLYPNDSRHEEAQNWYRVLKVLNDTKVGNAVLINKIRRLRQLDIQREHSIP